MEVNANLENQFKNTLKYIKENLDMFDKNKELKFKLEEKECEEFQSLEKEIEQFKRFKDIKRFSIPIIGMISCGKSSFLNFLLGINCLEKDDDITTKSVVIIRHNKNLKKDERYIYSVIIKERSEGYYDFEKDEKTQSKELNKVIKERNNFIKNSAEDKLLNKEDFFLIIEAKIPLFSDKNSIFGDFFEFLDLPGLNEGDKESKSFKSSNFFKENILPKLACNTLFSILMFDAGKYMSNENPTIFKEYLDKYFPFNYSNSFFILNKIDLMHEPEKEKKIFKDEMVLKKLKVNNEDDKTIHIQYLSCKELTSEVERFNDFQSFLKYLYIEGSKEKKTTNFFTYLKDKIKNECHIDISIIGNDTPNEEQNIDLKRKINDLMNEESNFKRHLFPKEYFNYSIAFEKKKQELQNEENNMKSEKYKELFDEFYLSFTNSMNYFIDIPNNQSISKRIKNITEIIDKLNNENEDSISRTQDYIDLLYKDLSNDAKLSIEQFQKLKPIVEELYENGKSFETFRNLKEEFELIDFFVKKNKKLRIPLFGGYSTGKSSTLNCIIGKQILPEGNSVTTRKIVVIRNNDENKYILCKTDFVKTNDDYYCFEDGEEIMSKDESNYTDIYNFLKEKNEDKNDENMFYLLKAPILLFKKLKMSKEILNKIELIDFPGVDVDDKTVKEIFNNIVQLSDTFIFMNECNLVSNSENIDIIKNIIERIENRRFTFDYNSCLFVLNKADKAEKIIDKNKKKKEFEKLLFKIDKFNSFIDYFKKRENPEISVTIFCSQYFLKYLSFFNEINDFEKYINKNIDETIEDNEGSDDFDLMQELEDKLLNIKERDFEKFSIEDVEENDENLLKKEILKECLNNKGVNDKQIKTKNESLKNIIKYYMNMINNLEKNQHYIDSRASLFFSDLEKFIISKEMTEKQYIEKIQQFIKEVQIIFKLLEQKSMNKKIVNISYIKIKMEEKISNIYKCYEESKDIIKNKIDNVFNHYIGKIDDLIKLENDKNIKASELNENFNNLKNNYINEMKNLDTFIKNHFFELQYKLDNQINSSLANFLLFGGESEIENNWYTSFNKIFELFGIHKFLKNDSEGLQQYLVGALFYQVYNILLHSKENLIKELKNMKKKVENQWDSVFFKCNTILIRSINEAHKNTMMIFETQMNQFNEKAIQSLFEKFIDVIGDKFEKKKQSSK